jgi:hypothetical protein
VCDFCSGLGAADDDNVRHGEFLLCCSRIEQVISVVGLARWCRKVGERLKQVANRGGANMEKANDLLGRHLVFIDAAHRKIESVG